MGGAGERASLELQGAYDGDKSEELDIPRAWETIGSNSPISERSAKGILKGDDAGRGRHSMRLTENVG